MITPFHKQQKLPTKQFDLNYFLTTYRTVILKTVYMSVYMYCYIINKTVYICQYICTVYISCIYTHIYVPHVDDNQLKFLQKKGDICKKGNKGLKIKFIGNVIAWHTEFPRLNDSTLQKINYYTLQI